MKDRRCTLIVVEDPATDFQRMKDSVDINLILQHGFFQAIRGLKKDFLDVDSFKECAVLEAKEVAEIRSKLKLRKDNVMRCFELLLLAHLDPNCGKVHEAYRKSVLKRFAECRDLLRPYFRFENFADRSMFTINDPVEQYAKLREKCCIGNGQLSCLVNLNRASKRSRFVIIETDHKALSADNFAVTNSPEGLPSKRASCSDDERKELCSGLLPFTTISNTNSVDLRLEGMVLDEQLGTVRNDLQPSSPNLRLNRFMPTPWHEIHGSQVRYELPKTLQSKIRACLAKHVGK